MLCVKKWGRLDISNLIFFYFSLLQMNILAISLKFLKCVVNTIVYQPLKNDRNRTTENSFFRVLIFFNFKILLKYPINFPLRVWNCMKRFFGLRFSGVVTITRIIWSWITKIVKNTLHVALHFLNIIFQGD